MRSRILFITSLVVTVATVAAWAGIPLPDVVLYGQVFINQQLQQPQDELLITARANGAEGPVVGSYRLRDSMNGYYVLRIRLESPVQGMEPSNDAAQVGDMVHISIEEPARQELPSVEYRLAPEKGYGYVEYLDLGDRVKGDFNGDAQVDLGDLPSFLTCMGGPEVQTRGQCPAVFDFDSDADVDLVDLRGFLAAFAGD